MVYTVSHYINNQRILADSGRFLEIYNPATGEVSGRVAVASPSEIDHAVCAARKAFTAWSSTTPARRTHILFKFNELLRQHTNELAELVTKEHGKTFADARGSVQRGIEVVEFACGIPQYLKGEFAESVGTGVDSYSMRQALGVCVGITPFNFPAMIGLWMFPLAIACGNTFIWKPSEKDPSCSIRIAELIHEAGLPSGVLNIVHGDKEVVDGLLTHQDVTAISFVGSTAVAEHVFKTATAQGKRVQAMGGAKNHAVILPDADLDQAADAIVGAAYGSAGERCMAISVVVVVGESTAAAVVEKLLPRVQALKIGDGMAPDVEMGPLVTQAHRERVLAYIDLGVQEGAKLLVDGRGFQHPKLTQGFYLGGCLFDHVRPEMRIYKEEIFGPVLGIVRVPDFETALSLVSQHEYGNGAAIFTRDGYFAREFASRVQIGMVGINVPIPVPFAYHNFSGWKRSVFADIGMYGSEGVRFYTKIKTVTQRWPAGKKLQAEFTIPTTR